MKILLIKPKWFVKGGVYRFLKGVKFTPLHLGILAALSKEHEVKVVDEDWEQIPYEEVQVEQVTLPDRVFNPEYERTMLPPELMVPNRY